MLFDVTDGCFPIDPGSLREIELYKAFERKSPRSTVEAVFKKITIFLDGQEPSESSQLVWVRLAKMWGGKSVAPNPDIVYIEKAVERAVGDGKPWLMLCGLLFMIAIADRHEKYWLCHKVESDDIDEDTGKFIAWRGYWINPDFVVPDQFKTHSFDDLSKKFNRETPEKKNHPKK